MTKVNCIYFSKNEIYELDVEYGITAISDLDIQLSTYYIEKDIDIVQIRHVKDYVKTINIYFLSYGCFDLLEKTSLFLKEKNPSSVNVVCMGLASELYEKILITLKSIDIAVIGKYEPVLNMLCETINKGEEQNNIPGIAYLKNGKLCVNKPTKNLNNLLMVNMPLRVIEDSENRFFHIYGTRDCEGHCTFCDRNCFSLNENKMVEYRTINNIINEIDELVEQYDCKFITFSDPTFGGCNKLKEKLLNLYKILRFKNYWIQFTLNLRAELINEEIIEILNLLKKVGLGKVFIGIETFNKKDLKIYGKIATLKDNYNCLNLFQKNQDTLFEDYWLEIEYGFINFNPYSSIQDLKNNLHNIKIWDIKNTPYIATSKLTINSLTNITKKVKKDGLIKCYEENNLSYLFQYSFNYNFKNREIEKIYNALSMMKNDLNIKNTNGLEFIRNRYYHFIGKDELLGEYDRNYKKLKSLISEITNDMCEFIYENYSRVDFETTLIKKLNIHKNKYKELEQNMRRIVYKSIVELKKIDELVYYRAVY